ncbi:ImmA/IrrE family metallo-endopeptidase [Aeromicrobium sp. 9AM]|uniref:ImmA/IrrE family metallo-endopeptidase n=1 Tax=Aeromicrobium sp. 9AM TaxID=2653126 RepID=UPI0012F2013E|nr:ImmA/IrrE family metallo-endopeptidase [Aeromicrobium sp. 9AM]VXB72521.1 conserved hypothetical protein [Aeromicrobium sp. 9AM]
MPDVPAWLSTKFDAKTVAKRAAEFVGNMDARHPGLVETLRDDPLEALAQFGEVTFTLSAHQQSGKCSVLGSYTTFTDPPTISVTRRGQGQTWFSALHELGHHEQQGDFAWTVALDTIDDERRRGRLEEQICEAFAAEILLGADVVDEIIGDDIPTAKSIADLHHATGASRAACAVRVLQLLRAEGLVMVATLEGEVLFSTGSGDVFAPKKGTVQPPDSVVARAADAGTSSSRDASVMYGTGRQQHGFAADAVRDDDYVYAVFTAGKPGWVTGFYASKNLYWGSAEHDCRCGATFTRGAEAYCETCNRGDTCPECGVCACAPEPVRDLTCTDCFMVWPTSHYLPGGTVCQGCRED